MFQVGRKRVAPFLRRNFGIYSDADSVPFWGNISLVYMNIPFWRAEVPRIALYLSGVDFQDKRVSREERPAAAEKTPFGQLPVLYVGDRVISQTGGICRFAGKMGGLYPDDLYQAAKVDEVIDFISDMNTKISPTMRMKDAEEKMAARVTLGEETLPKMFGMLETLIENNHKIDGTDSPFCIGSTMTVADLAVWRVMSWLTSGVLDGIPTTVAEPFPRLNRLWKTVDTHPGVIKWKNEPQNSKFYSQQAN